MKKIGASELTIYRAQTNQPWTVPYSAGVDWAEEYVPHILASHCVLHAVKSVGKIATVFEKLDHTGAEISNEERAEVARMAADLMTAALRFANLVAYDLATVFAKRVKEKNGIDILEGGEQ